MQLINKIDGRLKLSLQNVTWPNLKLGLCPWKIENKGYNNNINKELVRKTKIISFICLKTFSK